MVSNKEFIEEVRKDLKKELSKQFRFYKDNILESKEFDLYRVKYYSFYNYKQLFLKWLIYSELNTDVSKESVYKKFEELRVKYNSSPYAKIRLYSDIDKIYDKKKFSHLKDNKILSLFVQYCAENNVLFDKENRYDNFLKSIDEGIDRVKSEIETLLKVIYNIYYSDSYIKQIAPYLGIDIDRSLLLQVNVREQILALETLKKLSISDIEIDNKFNILFKSNKRIWNLILQISNI